MVEWANEDRHLIVVVPAIGEGRWACWMKNEKLHLGQYNMYSCVQFSSKHCRCQSYAPQLYYKPPPAVRRHYRSDAYLDIEIKLFRVDRSGSPPKGKRMAIHRYASKRADTGTVIVRMLNGIKNDSSCWCDNGPCRGQSDVPISQVVDQRHREHQ